MPKDHECTDGVECDHDVSDLNPRKQATKALEMTVRRALELIEEFEKLEDGLDWQDVPGSAYRRIIGERYEYGRLLEEVWNRYQGGTLYYEVLDLAENLPPSVLKKKEIKNGLDSIRDRLAS